MAIVLDPLSLRRPHWATARPYLCTPLRYRRSTPRVPARNRPDFSTTIHNPSTGETRTEAEETSYTAMSPTRTPDEARTVPRFPAYKKHRITYSFIYLYARFATCLDRSAGMSRGSAPEWRGFTLGRNGAPVPIRPDLSTSRPQVRRGCQSLLHLCLIKPFS